MRIRGYNDEFLTLSREAVEAITLGRLPGAFWVEYFPWLKYIPPWVPGSSARQFGEHFKPIVRNARSKAFYSLLDDMRNGPVKPSVAQKLIKTLQGYKPNSNAYKDFERFAIDATGVAYAAAVDTQFSATSSFILAMSMFPHVQAKAQQELDDVVGPGHLPTPTDMDSLPYIKAILSEVLRWQPVLPLGVPHCALEDDEYAGFAIPAGTTVIAVRALTMLL
ncbi:hypothetical protein EIP86_000433 [Pleurotus ostreatoroseus]|nr:hypothetical protein EIP86_000433 [Pleurotus ostreatoroseus]